MKSGILQLWHFNATGIFEKYCTEKSFGISIFVVVYIWSVNSMAGMVTPTDNLEVIGCQQRGKPWYP